MADMSDGASPAFSSHLIGESALKGSHRAVDFGHAKYIEACSVHFRAPLFMSIPTDKAAVRGLQLTNAVAVLPSNIAMVMAPQALVSGPRQSGGGGGGER